MSLKFILMFFIFVNSVKLKRIKLKKQWKLQTTKRLIMMAVKTIM